MDFKSKLNELKATIKLIQEEKDNLMEHIKIQDENLTESLKEYFKQTESVLNNLEVEICKLKSMLSGSDSEDTQVLNLD